MMERPTKSSTSHSERYVSSAGYAPWYSVPNKHIVSVENPFIIKNVDKGVETIGGLDRLQKVLKFSLLPQFISLIKCAAGPR